MSKKRPKKVTLINVFLTEETLIKSTLIMSLRYLYQR